MAGSSDTTVKFRADISQLKASMQQASRAVKLANSEFKAATAGMDDWAKSEEGLNAKVKQLNETLKAQKKQVDLANEAYEKTVKVYGENSAEADRAKMSLNNYEAALAKTEKQLSDYEKELEDCKNGTGNFADELEDVEDATAKASDGFTVMKGALADLVADGIKAAISAVKDLAKETFEVGTTFESSMSQVEAVSGATADEMAQLTAKAEEMGAKTKFSASESADAFNYMAMAGWKTEDMLGGIEGIMNLAAASGEDLATTSDIVTDALTAMGYGAADSGRLADVMAAASSNANTNVAMMGATFQYAAPIVGALGYNMEDTAVAIGLMANAGIKADKAGTALRSILTRLSAPPKECADAMEELGISLTDEQGNMKDLDEVMQDLRKAFAGLDETQQTANAKAIAGQEAMSGLLAIVNAAPEDYNKLTEAVENSAGAAKNMADTMNDNVGGQLTLLKSQIEGIMITVFNEASDSMTKGIHTIGDALNKVDWEKFGDGVGKFAEKVADFFNFVVSNSSTVINVLKTVGSVMATIFVVNKIGAFIGWLNSLAKTYTTLNAVMVGLRNTQLLLNAAQLASPIGLIVAGVTALAGAYLFARNNSKEMAEAEYGLTDAEKELHRSINETYEAQKRLNEQREAAIESTTGEFNYIQQLKDEYNGLIDSNGKVKKGYEDRANFILNELANALGVEIDTIKEEYTENGKLSKSIDELIQKKQAEATLSAYDESYRNDKSNEAQALQDAITAQNNYTDAKQKYLDIQSQYDQVEQKMHDAMQHGAENSFAYQQQLIELGDQLDVAKDKFNTTKEELDKANKAYQDGQTTIQNYEGLSAAIISGDVKKINRELGKLTTGFKDAKSSNQTELEQQVKDYEKYYQDIQQAMANGSPVVTQQMVNDAKGMVDKAKKELDKFAPQASESANDATSRYVKELENGAPQAEKAGKKVKDAAYSGTENPETDKTGKETADKFNEGIEGELGNTKAEGKKLPQEAKKGADTKDETTDSTTSGSNFGEGFWQGIGSWLSSVWERGKELAKNALGGLKAGQQEGSPSKLTTQSGIYFGQGFENGIKSTVKAVTLAATNVGISAVKSLREAQQEGSPSKLTYQSGKNFTQGFINGISSLEKTLVSKTKGMVATVVKELLKLDNFNFSEVTSNASAAFSKALSKQMEYTTGWIDYNNQKMLSDFDTTIESLQSQSENAITAATAASEKKQAKIQKKLEKAQNKNNTKRVKKLQKQLEKEQKAIVKTTANLQASYDKQIAEQQKMKDAYQQAASSMMSEFTSAMQEYQSQAQKLIDDTMNGITDKYQSQYDALVNKQDNLINKLKSAGDLFNLSNANVMTINDIKAQTEAIKQYASKLETIKKKVSSALFDQIADYDMKQGEAFIDRLLAMSDEELQAYSDAYDEKMDVAEQLSESIYKSDFDKVADEYETAIQQAFKDLPSQLEAIGTQVMEGFIAGLTTNTDYMDSAIRTFVSGMVDTFKSQLGIHSPSKVAMTLGAFTGEGFADGLREMVKEVKKAAESITDTVASSLDWQGSIDGARAVTSLSGANGLNRNAGTFSETNSQNVIFNQYNNSPKALDRLTIYRQTNNMLFSAKVRLADV